MKYIFFDIIPHARIFPVLWIIQRVVPCGNRCVTLQSTQNVISFHIYVNKVETLSSIYQMLKTQIIHIVTHFIPERVGRGAPTFHNLCYKPYVIEGELIATYRVQSQTPFLKQRRKMLNYSAKPTRESNPRHLAQQSPLQLLTQRGSQKHKSVV
ncbi:hypothetical protein SFRURICE_002778 [Spodoptera frugiperda]|nr:hypothetical protein SFRURICE_002778 [Spodoptera frugiperda]